MSNLVWPPEAEVFRQRLQHRLRNQAMAYEMNESDVQACLSGVLMKNDTNALIGASDANEEHFRQIADYALKTRRNELVRQTLAEV
jgi:hypothetical protein